MATNPIKIGKPCWLSPRQQKGYASRITVGSRLLAKRRDRGGIVYVSMADGSAFLDGSLEIGIRQTYLWPNDPAVEIEAA